MSSEFAAARLLTGLTRRGRPVANLTNTIVVESFEYGGGFLPQCQSSLSKRGGDLAAPGNDVWSLTGANSGAGEESGTSQATPQVAGAASFLWSLDDGRSPQSVISALKAAPGPGALGSGLGCSSTQSAPVLDAYAAVLAADHGLSSSLAPRRAALLDAADGSGAAGRNGAFDEDDLELFLAEFEARADAEHPDFSRYDLNGDGRTGDETTARLDLDMAGSVPSFATVEADLDGIPVTFDESGVSDREVLCYYAYSPLFSGDEVVRQELMVDLCGPAAITVEQFYAEVDDDRDCYDISIWLPTAAQPQPELPLTRSVACSSLAAAGTLSQPSEGQLALDANLSVQHDQCTPEPDCESTIVGPAARTRARLRISSGRSGVLRVVLSDPAEWIDQRTDRAAVGYQMYLDAGTGGTLKALFCGVSEVYAFGCYSFENNQATPLAERTVDIPVEPGEYTWSTCRLRLPAFVWVPAVVSPAQAEQSRRRSSPRTPKPWGAIFGRAVAMT